MPEAVNEIPQAGRLCVGIVTFHRAGILREVLEAVSRQTLPISQILVFDNGCSSKVSALCERYGADYIGSPSNIGPAGGTAALMTRFLEDFGPGDWLVRMDDDRPPPGINLLADLKERAERLARSDPMLAAVGVAGAVLDRERWRLEAVSVSPGDLGLDVAIPVDYLATGFFPMWTWFGLRSAGVMDSELFFGMTEVELGLRQRQQGLNLYQVPGPVRVHSLQITRSRVAFLSEKVSWRRYYSLRNDIVLARRYGGSLVALKVSLLRGVAQALLRLLAHPADGLSDCRLTAQALADAWRGRLGIRVDPLEWSVRTSGLTESDEMPPT